MCVLLKLYIGYPPVGFFNESDIVRNPDDYFEYYVRDLSFIDSPFCREVVKECSDVVEFLSSTTMRAGNGMFISPMQLSSGAKNVLIMESTDKICNMGWCGDNCNRFVEDIADRKDLTVFSGRVYIPYLYNDHCNDFLVLNKNKIYHSPAELTEDLELMGIYGGWDDER